MTHSVRSHIEPFSEQNQAGNKLFAAISFLRGTLSFLQLSVFNYTRSPGSGIFLPRIHSRLSLHQFCSTTKARQRLRQLQSTRHCKMGREGQSPEEGWGGVSTWWQQPRLRGRHGNPLLWPTPGSPRGNPQETSARLLSAFLPRAPRFHPHQAAKVKSELVSPRYFFLSDTFLCDTCKFLKSWILDCWFCSQIFASAPAVLSADFFLLWEKNQIFNLQFE